MSGMCLLDWDEDWMEGRFLRVHLCGNCGWRTPLAKDRQLVTKDQFSGVGKEVARGSFRRLRRLKCGSSPCKKGLSGSCGKDGKVALLHNSQTQKVLRARSQA